MKFWGLCVGKVFKSVLRDGWGEWVWGIISDGWRGECDCFSMDWPPDFGYLWGIFMGIFKSEIYEDIAL